MDYSGLKILVVEDEPLQQKVATMILGSVCGKVDLAINGMQAIEMFKENDYDLIFMDIGLPDTTGMTVAKSIRLLEKDRHVPEKKQVPIVALTAHCDPGLEEKIKESGMQGFHSKPLLLADIDQYARLANSG